VVDFSLSIVYYSVVMGQFHFILWLAYWYTQSESFEFEWDEGNTSKNRDKHGVPKEEVESAFDLKLAVPIGRQTSPPVEEERLCVVGPSAQGRLISVVFTLRSGKVRPISARPASRKERKLYEDLRKTIEAIR
jgi:uncharacterized DUF497 family protein